MSFLSCRFFSPVLSLKSKWIWATCRSYSLEFLAKSEKITETFREKQYNLKRWNYIWYVKRELRSFLQMISPLNKILLLALTIPFLKKFKMFLKFFFMVAVWMHLMELLLSSWYSWVIKYKQFTQFLICKIPKHNLFKVEQCRIYQKR